MSVERPGLYANALLHVIMFDLKDNSALTEKELTIWNMKSKTSSLEDALMEQAKAEMFASYNVSCTTDPDATHANFDYLTIRVTSKGDQGTGGCDDAMQALVI